MGNTGGDFAFCHLVIFDEEAMRTLNNLKIDGLALCPILGDYSIPMVLSILSMIPFLAPFFLLL